MNRIATTLAMTGALLLAGAPATAEITLVEDFSSYPLDQSIHDQGDWTTFLEPHWQAQQNSTALVDHGWSKVVQMGNQVALSLINRDTGGELDTVYTAVNLGMNHAIYDTGTIYVRFMSDGPGDTMMATNGHWAGWDYGSFETGDVDAPSFQGAANGPGGYATQATLVEVNAGPWEARNGGGYDSFSPPSKVARQAYELWMQFDVGGDRVRYYFCEDGGTPALVPNATGGEWYAFRDTTDPSIENIKFFAGSRTWQTEVWIESIAVNASDWVTDRYADWTYWTLLPPPPCDPDGDGDIDLDDFVILKRNFGTMTGATCADGDFDGDGDVDLDDFVILKRNFGITF